MSDIGANHHNMRFDQIFRKIHDCPVQTAQFCIDSQHQMFYKDVIWCLGADNLIPIKIVCSIKQLSIYKELLSPMKFVLDVVDVPLKAVSNLLIPHFSQHLLQTFRFSKSTPRIHSTTTLLFKSPSRSISGKSCLSLVMKIAKLILWKWQNLNH